MRPIHLALGVLVTLIWGANFSVIEVGLEAVDPFVLTTLRFAFTAMPLMFFIGRPKDVPIGAIAAYGVVFGVGLWGVVNIAMAGGLSPGISSLVLQFAAFITVICSAVFFNERISIAQCAGMAVGSVGLMTVIGRSSEGISGAGVALVLVAAVNWSLCNIIIKKFRPSNMLPFIIWSSGFSAPALALLTLVIKGAEPFKALPMTFTWGVAGSVLFQAYVTTVFGYAIWNYLMKTYPASSVAPLSLLVPISGIATSAVVFGETFPHGVWLGIALMLAGIALFVLAPKLRRASTA
jgi:O-acetylserine/cysteine efflux transporter